ncbi:MAG TPA: glycosyltransferase family 39 protein [Myxococcales bacterium]|nr:glycosyltransferase family 39 protein [Myxococcales bacterium]
MKGEMHLGRLVVFGMALVAGFGLILAFAFVCADYPIEWAEGRVFETARLILSGAPLYCDIRVLPCADVTYPPAYAALVAGLAKIAGLSFNVGRAPSFAALLWALFSLYRIARASSDRFSALAAPAVFLAFVEACYFAAAMRPDMLSLALLLCGMDVLVRRPSLRGTVASALLVSAGMFVKPQSFATVFAMCAHLALVDRKRLAVFAVVGVAAGIAIVGVGEVLTGFRFLDHHFRYVVGPTHTLAQLGTVLYYGLLPWALFAAVALVDSLRAVRAARPGLVPIYFLSSLIWALVAGTGKGAAANYFFELYAAAALAISPFVHQLRDGLRDRVLAAAFSLQVALCVVLNPWIGLERYLSLRKLWSNGATLRAWVGGAPEPILVEELGVAGYTGHRLFVNPYVVTQLAEMARSDEGPLLAMLRERRFSRVVLRESPADHPNPLQLERFTPEMLRAIAASYRLSWSDGSWLVYEPR